MVEYYFVASDNINSDPWMSEGTALDLSNQYPDVIYDLSSLEEEGDLGESGLKTQLVQQVPPASIQKPTPPPANDECKTNDECNDHDGCTMDQCTGTPKKCVQAKTTPGCAFGTRFCVPYFRTYKFTPDTGAYCGLDGKWIDQQGIGAVCTGDYECLSGLCQNKQCVEPDQKEAETPPLVQAPAALPPPLAANWWWESVLDFFSKLFGS